MRVTVYLADGGTLSWENLPAEDTTRLAETLMGDSPAPRFVQMTMDDVTVIFSTAHVVRVEIEG
jgi:hypothetical protein